MNKELLIPLGIIALTLAFLDPFMLLMPASLVYVLILLLLVASLSYSLLIWREKALDEREEMHRAYAGRVSFIAGVGILILGIVYQTLIVHEVDPVLVAAVAIMTLAKYFGHRYAQNRY